MKHKDPIYIRYTTGTGVSMGNRTTYRMTNRPLWCLLALAACTGHEKRERHAAPEVEILAPADGEEFYAHTPMRFEARVSDADTPLEALVVEWTTSFNGRLYGDAVWEGDVSVLEWPDGLAEAGQEVEVEVVDPEGNAGTDGIDVEIDENEAPTGRFLQPSRSAVLDADGLLTIEVQIEDRETPPELLELGWAGTLDMDETPDNPGREGRALFQVPAEPGSYDLTLAIIDEADQSTIIDYSFYVYASDYDGDGYASTSYGGDDCDDYDAASYPGAEEVCDYQDNDCDGAADEAGATGEQSRYPDADYDGYGSGEPALSCWSGSLLDGDCNDQDYAIHPGMTDTCDGIDNDCDGLVDADDPGVLLSQWHADSDGDGYGESALLAEGCEAPAGAVTDNSDCDDGAASVYPWAPEICDGQNNNCWYAGSWTADWEDGLAGWTAEDGTWSDATALLSGAAGAPALLTLTSGGRLRICGGVWYARIAVAATPVEIEGSGAADTILDASGEADGLRIVLAGAAVTLRDLALTGGAGCRPGISNHDGPCEAPVWYPGVSLAMEAVQVYDNEGDSATADDASGVILQGGAGSPVVWTMADSAVYGNGVDHGPRLGAGSLVCTGQPTEAAGFWAQQEGLRLEAGGTLDSQGCDWLGTLDNTADIAFSDGSAATGYGDDATFTCDGDLRSCMP